MHRFELTASYECEQPQVCDTCCKVSLLDLVTTELPHDQAIALGPLETIIRKASVCEICRVVTASFQGRLPWYVSDAERTLKSLQGQGDDTAVWLYSYVFFREPQSDRLSLRIGVSTNRQGLLNRISRRTHIGNLQLIGMPSQQLDPPMQRPGREILKLADMVLARAWLDECLKNHGALCDLSDGQADPTPPSEIPTDLRVIDVTRRCLMSLPIGSQYLALSYCWPKVPGLTNTTSRYPALHKDGAIVVANGLSTLIDEACKAVNDLGERYLWVDALCIIQDSLIDKAVQIGQMDIVYGCALMTIVVAPDLQDPDQLNLPGYLSPGSLREQIKHTVAGAKYAVPKPCLEDILANTRWDSRGWTFQEFHLSRRALYFTSVQLYFQCSCGVRCEDTVGEGHVPEVDVMHSTNLWNPKSRYSTDKENDWGDLFLSRNGYDNEAAALRAYNNFVSYYAGRELSYQSDALNGFRGIEKVLSTAMNSQFYAGLVLSWLDYALLWQPVSNTSRRDGFPTFSWAGWTGYLESPFWLNPLEIRASLTWFRSEQRQWVPCDKSALITTTVPDFKSQTELLPAPSDTWSLATVTQIASFRLSLESANPEHQGLWPDSEHLWVLDNNGRRAGLILISCDWKTDNVTEHNTHDFMFLSQATKGRVDDICCFDDTVFVQREWCLANIMLVNIVANGVVRRISVGVIHSDAWSAASKVTRGVRLD